MPSSLRTESQVSQMTDPHQKPHPKPCTSLDDLRARLEAIDLIPSQEPLRERIAERFALLARAGINSVVDLQSRLKSRRSVESLAADSGIDEDYLVLLRRAVQGFYPRPRPLRAFDWVDENVIAALEAAGVKNSQQLNAATEEGLAELAERAHVPVSELAPLAALCELVSVQWVSPSFARALVAAGFPSSAAVAQADPDLLCRAVATANGDGRFYKGSIGRRDISRVIDAAGYVPSVNSVNDST